jgi:PhoH-like ATPase
VVLDTCVLVADPQALDQFPGYDIVLPLTVIEELDSLKTRLDEAGRGARAAVRNIEALRVANGGSLTTAAMLANGSTVRIETNGLRLDRLDEFGLDRNKADNRILAAALGVQDTQPSTSVVSLDVALRVKASQLGLEADDYAVRSKLTQSSNIRTEDVEASVVDTLHRSGDIDIDDPRVAHLAARPNQVFVLRAPNAGSVLARAVGSALRSVNGPTAWGLRPRSAEQRLALDLLLDPAVPIVALSGPAGTGKTILTIAAALEQVFEPASRRYDRLLILRPVVSVGRQDLGYLPGTVEEKLGPWFEAVVDTVVALSDTMTHRDARQMISLWVESGSLELEAVTFLRGRSLQRTLVVLDEAQNLEPLVAKTVLTRLGEGSKAILLGDVSQIDSPWLSESSNALAAVTEAVEGSELFAHMSLVRCERSAAADLASKLL